MAKIVMFVWCSGRRPIWRGFSICSMHSNRQGVPITGYWPCTICAWQYRRFRDRGGKMTCPLDINSLSVYTKFQSGMNPDR